MRTLVIYDSYFGFTEQIARKIKDTLQGETEIVKIQQFDLSQWNKIDRLIIGSPTQGFRPTEDIVHFVRSLGYEKVKAIKIATFDTRIELSTIKSGFMRFIVNKVGYAANFMAKELKKLGGTLVMAPEGFLVMGEQGPLKEGELERAAHWAEKLDSI
jgi:flavodoxin